MQEKSEKEKQTEAILKSLGDDIQADLGISAEEAYHMLIQATTKTGNPKFIKPSAYLKDKYTYAPVSPTQWLMDRDYFGRIGESVWPVVSSEFIRVMESNPRPLRLILKGAIGWGKTFLSDLIMARLLYELGCLRRPQEYFGLSGGSMITFMNLSTTATHARRVFFSGLKEMIDASPWFREKFPRDTDVESVLIWRQKNISFVPGSSSELAPLGENLFGGVIEEANFFQVSSTSKKIRSVGEREWDQAKKLHDSIWRRMKSRYQKVGRLPGMLILNSSAKYPDDFLEKISKESDSDTLMIEHSGWETKPPSRYSGKKFYVFVGNNILPPKIMRSDEEAEAYRLRGRVEEVPVEYQTDFERDIEGSVRDEMGVNVKSVDRFITQDEKISTSVATDIPVPFSEVYGSGLPFDSLPDSLQLGSLVSPFGRETKPVLLMHPNATRFAHIDLGISTDSCGLCVCHIGEVMDVTRTVMTQAGSETRMAETRPLVYVDLLLKIVPPIGGEIQIETIRNILHDCSLFLGFKFARITYDQFQSKDSQQLLKKRFGDSVVGYLSVDKTADPYNVLKETIYENRLRMYYYEPVIRELRQLMRDSVTGKINHPPGGAKDTADALAGAVWNATVYMGMGVRDENIYESLPNIRTAEEILRADSVRWLRGDPEPSPDEDIMTEEALWAEMKPDEEDMQSMEDYDKARKFMDKTSAGIIKIGW
jgi:hypothetical protein